ncbi:MAG TPA: haloacid dehalogenase type II [Anaeromyxobacteraceae bacterium]|nr:haloacid dehalogenase type II [Anaeromyxobacteraceae bacterium]
MKALTFDVFGTVVDWRGSILREGRALARARELEVDWGAFADAWRAGYRREMDRVGSGELPWTNVDRLHRLVLDRLVVRFGLRGLGEPEKEHLNRVWHRLRAWPDSVRGLRRLKRRFLVATLSNGNVSLLADMARHCGLPWDVVLSAELFRHYKPDREVYQGAVTLLDLEPPEVMMVAAHKEDLAAARGAGLRTAFVRRPLEHGPGAKPDLAADPRFDVCCDDLLELADRLGA